jgi:hypothetical protein
MDVADWGGLARSTAKRYAASGSHEQSNAGEPRDATEKKCRSIALYRLGGSCRLRSKEPLQLAGDVTRGADH